VSLFRKKKRALKKPQLLTPSKLVSQKENTPTSSSLTETEKQIKEILGNNEDLRIKHFKIFGQFSAACVYFSSLVDKDSLNKDILKPLMYEPEHLIGKEKPLISIKIQYESEIDEKESVKIQLSDSAILKIIEKETSKNIKGMVEKFIVSTQKKKADIFGFGEHFRAKLPQYWNKNVKTKAKWDEIYQNVTFDVKVDAHIHRVGMKSK
jgi:spore germination protein KA